MTKRLGILTSGGDCAGLNAAIRAVTLRATEAYNWEVFGIRRGTTGLLQRPVDTIPLTAKDVGGALIRQGGTFLGSVSRGDPFAYPVGDGRVADLTPEIIEGIKFLELDALIGIGGDGSLEIISRLVEIGKFGYVAIPKTIDNDVGFTEQSIGFATAVDVATEALDRLQPTAASHDRIMILEVMGRDAGHIALHTGIAGGADVILIPEIPYRLENIAEKIRKIFASGRDYALVIVSESVATETGEKVVITDESGKSRYGGISHYLADKLSALTGAETRYTVLGHVQRGAAPSAQDRLLASALGVHAVDLVAQGKFNRMVAWRNNAVTDAPIHEVVKNYQAVDVNGSVVHTARGLGISLGDAL